jgi:hypothetical protein
LRARGTLTITLLDASRTVITPFSTWAGQPISSSCSMLTTLLRRRGI